MRSPISGGLGFSISPLRTSKNCSQVPLDGVTGNLAERFTILALHLQPFTPRAGPQDRLGAEHVNIRFAGLDRIAARMHGHIRAGLQAAHHDAHNIDGFSPVIHPRRDFDKILPGEIGNRVEHVRTRIEQHPAAGDVRLLPPRADRVRPPVLPDRRADAEQFAHFAGTQHFHGRAHLRRQAALKRHHQVLTACGRGSRSGCALRPRSSPSAFRAARPARLPGRLWPARDGTCAA